MLMNGTMHRQSDDGREHLYACFNVSSNEISYTLPPYTKQWRKLLDSKEEQWMFDENANQQPEAINDESISCRPLSVVVYTTG